MDTTGARTKRLFVAVPVDESLLPFIGGVQRRLEHTRGVRLLGDGQLHCTLAFIGQADAAQEGWARQVVGGVDPDLGGVVMLDRLVYLPNARRCQVIALGTGDETGVLASLHEAVMSGLERVGVMERDDRPFRPHVTIARLRTAERVQPTADCGRASFGVESVCLYQSELRPDGAVHREIERRLLQIA